MAYETNQTLKLERLRGEIQAGLDQLDRGKSADGEAFMKSLMEKPGDIEIARVLHSSMDVEGQMPGRED